MESFKSKLLEVRQLLDQCGSHIQIYINICELMEDLSKEMYAIREDQKRIIASNRSLDMRYGEMMNLLRDIRQTQLKL